MKGGVRYLLALMAALLWIGTVSVLPAHAQRRVNPVKTSPALQGKNENRQPGDSIDYSKLMHYQDEKGNSFYIDTVTGREIPDTLSAPVAGRVPKMLQPLLFSTAVGIDLWDPIMRLFGQHYGLIEFSGELNLHNRYIPVVEVGVGTASSTPEESNFTYKVPLTPYFRIGCNYNFIYNSNPDYMAFAGVRFGWSHFSYDINDVSMSGSYWGEEVTFNFPRQTANVSYLQFLFGIRVKLSGPISMGWNLRYKAKLHESRSAYGQPWYIPGYGSRNGAFAGSFSVTYTIPFRRKEPVEIPDALADDGGMIAVPDEPATQRVPGPGGETNAGN